MTSVLVFAEDKTRPSTKTFIPSKTKTPPVIDGKFEKTWETATELSNFCNYQTGKTGGARTRAYVMYDNLNLYIAFRCDETNLSELQQQSRDQSRDGSTICNNDRIEVFISPRNDGSYYQFAVNWCGALLDGLYNSKDWTGSTAMEWNGNWHAAAAVNDSGNEWIVEMSIPFSTLKINPGKNISMGMNFCRGKTVSPSEISCWSCTYGGLHKPDKFGMAEQINISEMPLSAENPQQKAFLGENTFRVKIKNRTPEDFKGGIILLIKDSANRTLKTIQDAIAIKGNSENDTELKYNWEAPGKFIAEAYCRKDGTKELIQLSSEILFFKEILFFNDCFPIVYEGEAKGMSGKLFFPNTENCCLNVEVSGNNGIAAEKKMPLKDLSGLFIFSLPPIAKAGIYELKISLLKNDRPVNSVTMPLRVIKPF